MLLTVCIEAGRKTLTHTSWTGLISGSRKWMSGQAAVALVAPIDSQAVLSLKPPYPRFQGRPRQAQGDLRLPFAFYLS